MRLPLASQSASDAYDKGQSTERLINLYPVPAPEGSASQYEIRSVPGLRIHCALPGPFLRGMRKANNVLYAVTRGAIHRVRADGTSAYIGAIPDDPDTGISSNRTALTLTAQGDYLIHQSDEMTQPPTGPISAEGSVTFIDQFTVLGERGGRKFEWTEPGLPAERNGLNFASAESTDDDIVRVASVGGYLVILKEASWEIWASTGQGSFRAFARVPGGAGNIGLKGFNLVTEAKDRLFFVGNDSVAYVTAGATPEMVSPPHVAQSLRRNKPTHCFYYEDRGHRFCVIRFSDRPAWVYDIATQRWHERAWSNDHLPWPIVAAEYCYGEWHLAAETGEIYRPIIEPIDAGQPMRRTLVSRDIQNGGKPFTVALLQIFGRFAHSLTESGPDVLLGQDDLPIRAETGEPLLSQGQNAMTTERPSRIWLRVSDDGGNTFGLPKMRDVARKGQHKGRARWHALGQHERFCVEVNLTDPVEMPLQSDAEIEVVP